jgi:hypothetical protein
MKSFKQYILEIAGSFSKKNVRPQDIINRRMSDRRGNTNNTHNEKQPDFDDPAFTHQFNKSLKDSEKWPPKPAAKYKADQIRWAVSAGKQPEHLAKES